MSGKCIEELKLFDIFVREFPKYHYDPECNVPPPTLIDCRTLNRLRCGHRGQPSS